MSDLQASELEQMAQSLVDFAFSDRVAAARSTRKARSFIESNASWIAGFRRADMSCADIAKIIGRMGYPISAPQLSRVASACTDRIDPALALRFERLVRLRRLQELNASPRDAAGGCRE